METKNHKAKQCSYLDNEHNTYYFAQKKQFRGVHFDVVNILLTIFQINQQLGMYPSLEQGESSLFMQKIRKNPSDFADFVLLKSLILGRCLW